MSQPAKHQINARDGSPCGATFSISREGGQILYDSRGTTAGTRQYRAGIVLMLRRLAAAGVTITRIAIDTRTTTHLSLAARTLNLPQPYPLDLAQCVTDDGSADNLRACIHTAASKAGRAPGASGGGNGTKRLRIWIDADAGALLAATITGGALEGTEAAA